MKKENIKEKFSKTRSAQRGISILLAVLILAAVLSIGLGISIISVQQVKMQSEAGYSVIAFYAAENGIEQVLMATGTPPSIGTTTLSNGATYKVTVRAKGGGRMYCRYLLHKINRKLQRNGKSARDLLLVAVT